MNEKAQTALDRFVKCKNDLLNEFKITNKELSSRHGARSVLSIMHDDPQTLQIQKE